jgi:phosphoglucosamine mutase
LYPQALKSVPYKGSNPLENSEITKKITQIQTANSEMRISVRKSGTERLIRIMVEGKSEEKIQEIISEIEELI